MAVNVTNLILGPATLYTAPFGSAGATEPTDAQVNLTPASSAGWIDAGGTVGGVKLSINQTYTVLNVDQVVDTVGRRLTSRDIQVITQMAEATLDNLAVAINGGTVATAAAPVLKTYDPATALSATQPAYTAILFDGWAPNQFRRRVIVRKCLSMASVDTEYREDAQALWPVSWGAHYVSSVITPFHICDASQ